MPRRDLSTEKNNPHIESQGFMLEYIERGLFIPMRFYNVENYKKLLLFRANSIVNHFFILPLLNKRMFCWKMFNPASWLPQRAICCLFCYRFRLSSSQTSLPLLLITVCCDKEMRPLAFGNFQSSLRFSKKKSTGST